MAALSTIALTTDLNIKQRLGLTDAEYEENIALIQRAIEAATGYLERHTGRNLASRDYTLLEIDGNGKSWLNIPEQYIPVTALTVLTLKDASLTTSISIDVSTSVNQLRWNSAGRLTLYPDATWSTFPLGHQNILVSFTGGLSDDLTDPSYVAEYELAREACELLVGLRFNEQTRDPSIKSISSGDTSITYSSSDMDSLPGSISADIKLLRSWGI